MKRINLLNEEISNKIAAGEVVERPASVVKEIIENSIDAESKNITVEIHSENDKSMKIIDDGIGIHSEDIHKAFMTHGTSKIISAEDLFAINTFGFRGEALPSIAAVSKVALKSRTTDVGFGKEIYIEGGKTEYIKDVGCNVGTSIEIRDLFFNVPARQKFLKSDQRESSLISNIVSRLALANPDIAFKYYNNNKRSLATYASSDVKDTIRSIYGKTIYDNIIGFEKHTDIISVHGYIGNSDISRGSRNNQSIFVNKRFIKSGLITAAVENAFKSFLTINKHPFFVIFLDIYPEFIDVNVHPTKSEIKFEDERVIYKSVFNAVHEAIGASVKAYFLTNDNGLDNGEEANAKVLNTKIASVQLPIDLKEECIYERRKTIDLESDNYMKSLVKEVHDSEIGKSNISYDIECNYLDNDKLSMESNNLFIKDDPLSTAKEEKQIKTQGELPKENEAKFPLLNIIGQYNNTYILGESSGTFYMIDQHAAHEKILFEKFKQQIENSNVISQILLTPLVVELNSEEFVYYNENTRILNEAGFIIEDFGDNTISIREAPMLLGKVSVREFFLEILDNIKNLGSGKITEAKYNMIASLACKAAIKANHSLSHMEMSSLVDELRYIEEPFNCPHGRPTIIKMSLMDIEKRFKRI